MRADKQRANKRAPKRFQPRGISILHEDRDLLVVDKESGLLTVGNDKLKGNSAFFFLTDYIKKGNPKSRKQLFLVHRLDRDTSGILVFAKSVSAQRYLQDEWAEFAKKYVALVHGRLGEKEAVITSYLAENSIHRMYSVLDPKRGKLAKTGYRVVSESKKFSLLDVDLLTGKKNQIRVHFAEKGCPVAGDKKYGRKGQGIKRLMLHAASLVLTHPHTQKPLTFEARTPAYFKTLLAW